MTDKIPDRLAQLSPEQRALVFEKLHNRRLQAGSHNGAQSLPIPAVRREGPLPLSFAQQRLWFLDQLGSGSAYNIPALLRLQGDLNCAVLDRVLNEIVRRHESLRTTFTLVNGEPAQLIAPALPLQLPVVDLAALPADQQATEVQRLTQAEALHPFDLSSDLLLRATLLRLGADEHVLLLTLHHIAGDGWSLAIFVRELTALYHAFMTGLPSPLPDLTIQYADFAHWQRQWLQGARLTQHLAYWKEQLAGAPPLLTLPTDYPCPASATFQGSQVLFEINADVTHHLRRLSVQAGTTLFMTLLAAFQVFLARYSGQDDIVVGSPIANRTHAALEPLIGFFVNTLALRVKLSDNPTFLALLEQVRQVTQAAYEHQELPFERLVEELQPARALNYNPLVQVVFALQNSPLDAPTLADLKVTAAAFAVQNVRFDLELHLRESDDQLNGYAIYNTALFDAVTMQRMMGHFQTLLADIVINPEQRIGELQLLTQSEREQLLIAWNDTKTVFPQDQGIPQLFETQAARTPDAIAVVLADPRAESRGRSRETAPTTLQFLTYRQLNEQANQLAHRLIALGVRSSLGANTLVAVAMEPSLALVVSLLAVFKAGGVYVPIDPTYPSARIRTMLADSAASILLTQSHLPMVHEPEDDTRYVIAIDQVGEQLALYPISNPPAQSGPNHLAYVIYTSGSTGQPKGIQVEMSSLVNLCHWYQQFCSMNSELTVLQIIPAGFDASIKNFLTPLICGAKLVLPPSTNYDPQLLCDVIQKYEVNVVNCVPSAFYPLVDLTEATDYFALRTLQLVAVGGEATNLAKLTSWLASGNTQCTLANLYGPTECTDITLAYKLPKAALVRAKTLPLGRPIDNMQVYLLDPYLQPTPIGVTGELYIAGVGVGHRYHKRPELTQEKFIANPFGAGRLYKTGDLARWLPNGTVEFLGRSDHQVKVRGFRIELGEIEALLTQHPAVREAVVTTHEDQSGEQSLIACVTVDQLNEQLASQHLGQWQSLYEEAYQQPHTPSDLTFNITGWNSSYTSLPLKADEMQEWLDFTIQELRALQPTHVLEIGCGSGLLLARLAPDCVTYWGTDYAASALQQVQRLKQTMPTLGHVSLSQRMADDFDGIEPATFDLVILNSVVQYFPSVEYLVRVLEGAVRVVKPNGFIYIGDVRDFTLLSAYHASVQTVQAPAELTRAELRQRVQQHVWEEEELLLDPAFFGALQSHLPQIKRVQFHLKRGLQHNELTRFRYQVILQIDPEITPQVAGSPFDHQTQSANWLNWQQASLTLAALRNRFGEQPVDEWGVRNIPNARLQAEALILAWLDGDHEESVGQLRQRLTNHHAGVDPEALWGLRSEFPFDVDIWSNARDPFTMDVHFRRANADRGINSPSPSMTKTQPRAWSAYANNPLLGKLKQTLVPQLRRFLQAQLPPYMLPSAFVLLDTLPLTPNGKIDRKALPALTALRASHFSADTAPRTATEQTIAQIWCEVMGMEQISIDANFFEIGGHSLLAAQIALRIRQAFLLDLPLRTLFECTTVAKLAERIDDTRTVLKLQTPANDEQAQEEILL